ncbi:chitinase class I [Nitrosomonas sp. Nm84]|uniref:glycoside hydrolase family 19 protein n=1 Tax=Nitrosomonas sp. Nm84 TaxID=200124 RepID=UPI000D75F32F|nr:glycoside hydrolase family 19 protein [Nitrosomonas sp. Nm84]PXW86069.1 chitinase class I [Nitrosomonas sp. Nm84]
MKKLIELMRIVAGQPTLLKSLDSTQLIELQTALITLGYPAGDIDGKYGAKTRNAWAEFLHDTNQAITQDTIDAATIAKLQASLDNAAQIQGYDFSSKAGTINAIKQECIRQGIGLKSQIAYVLATADHETNHTFKPVTEAYWLADPDAYLKQHHADYYPYYGRGYVQLTWDYNYEKYGKLIGEDLVHHPELALKPEIALFVLVHGFKTGAFTGRKISDYINAHTADFVKARYCINGKDKANEIAELAKNHLASL